MRNLLKLLGHFFVLRLYIHCDITGIKVGKVFLRWRKVQIYIFVHYKLKRRTLCPPLTFEFTLQYSCPYCVLCSSTKIKALNQDR
jgi:hypothetical protein